MKSAGSSSPELFARLDCIVDAMQENMTGGYEENIQAFFGQPYPNPLACKSPHMNIFIRRPFYQLVHHFFGMFS